MNLTNTFSVVVCAFLGIGTLQAQYYDQEIDFQGLNYRSLESAKMVTDIPGSDEAIAVGGVAECTTCADYDVSVTYFDAGGSVSWSIQYGQSNVTEVANATVIGDFQDRIIVVGQVGNRDALIAAIEVPSGAVLWSQRIGDFSPGVIENLTSVIALNPGSGEYIALGTVETTSSGQTEIYSVGFDDSGNINWMYSMDDYANAFPEMIPTNMALTTGTSPYPVVVGQAISSSQQLLFSARIDPSTGAMYWFRTFDLFDGTNNALSTAGDICAISSSELAVTFTAEGILPGTGTNSLICYMPMDMSFSPTLGVAYTFHTSTWSPTHAYHYGVGIYENGGDLDIGVRFTDGTGPSWDGVPAFLKIDVGATVLTSTAYNSHSQYLETGMVRHSNGYWIKTRREDDNFNLNGIDFSGSTGTTCDWTPTWSVNKVKVYTRADEVLVANHGSDANYSLNDQNTSGINYECNGGSSPFKKATVSVENVDLTSGVYPSLVSNNDEIRVSSSEFNGQNVSIVVSNTLGQILYTQNSDAKEGDVFNIAATELSQGINLVTVTDANGLQLINARVIKQ